MFFRTRSHFHIRSSIVAVCSRRFWRARRYSKSKDNQVTLASYELIGTVNIPTGTQFEGTEIGGLSSITYDSEA